MKVALLFFLILPLSVLADRNGGGFGAINGTVSTSDGHPAAYVTVLLKSTGQGATTDEKGNFEFKKIRAGKYILHVSLLGYSDSDIAVEVKENEIVFLHIQLKENYSELNKVTVAANSSSAYVETKISESLHLNLPLNEIPQNIAVITHQTLADHGLVSMTEAIRTVSGVQKTYGGLNDYTLIIRGTDATWSIFRNGVGGYWWNQQEDIAMLEKIEFVKGPAGFMTSVAQPGGFVNNVTKQPAKEQIASIEAGYGSFNLVRITADFGGSFSKASKFSYRFNAGIQEQDRAFQFSNASRYFICAALKYDFNKKTSVTAEYNYEKGRTSGNNDGLPSLNGKMFALPRDFAVADANTDRLTAVDNYYRVHFNHAFNDNWQLNAQLAYVNGTWGGYTLHADGDVPVSNDTLYRAADFADLRIFSKVAQLFFGGKFYTGNKFEHKVLLGIDYCNSGFTNNRGGTWGEEKFGLYIPNPDYYINPDSLKNFETNIQDKAGYGWTALYVQDHLKIAGKLVVTIAGRLTHAYLDAPTAYAPDYQKNTKYNVFTPRAGLTWLFSNDISLYAMYDQSFWPQIGENFDHKPFDPLTGYDIETGMKGYFCKKRLGLNLSVYNIVKNNTITADPLHQGQYIQTGQITSNGIDFDVTGIVTNALTVNANYAYTDAKITKDSDPKNVGMKNLGTPDHVVNLWLKYSLLHHNLKGLSFAVGYQYMGKRSAAFNWTAGDPINYLPTYNLLDAAISYHN
jgi:iron complex outermembrane receptor protein